MRGLRRLIDGVAQRRMRACEHVLALVLLGAALGGCDDDLPEATHITHMRLLGARVEVIGAEDERATPRPGERVRLSFATVFPTQEGSPDDSQMLLITCTAPGRFTGGLPLCQEFLDLVQGEDESVGDALSEGAAVPKVDCELIETFSGFARRLGVDVQCVDGSPDAEFEVPEDFAAEQVLFLGVLCEEGEAFLDPRDPTLFGCDDNDGETLRLHGLIPVAREAEEENLHPSMEQAELRFDDSLWLPVDLANPPPDENCEREVDGETVLIVDPLEHTIELSYAADARETAPDGELETLEFSVYATREGLERRFTVFSPDAEVVDGRLNARLEWDPPSLPRPTGDDEDPPPTSVLVRFYITVLDQRGGFDVATRAVCMR